MSNYIIFLVIVIIGYILYRYQSQKIIVYEPFTRKFFNKIVPTYFFGVDLEQLLGNEYDLIQLINEFIPYNLDTVLVGDSVQRYNDLNNNKIQFMLSRTHTLHSVLFKTSPGLENIDTQNIRFIATLHRIPITILCNNLQLSEFGDLQDSGLTVNVGAKYSGDYFAALDLILEYNLVVGRDLNLTFYEWPELLDHYGVDVDVVILTVSHPNMQVSKMSLKKYSRFLEIRRFNDGNLEQVSLDETPFYKTHYYYHKTVMEKEFLAEYYSNLILDQRVFNPDTESPLVIGQGKDQNRFIYTIGIQYYLFGNIQTPAQPVAQLLYNMKINIAEVNKFPFIDKKIDSSTMGDFTLNIPTHPGAYDFYFKSGIYTQIDNNNCILIDGKCTYQTLYDHNLLKDFGLTFDQIYNSDPPPNTYLKSFESMKNKLIREGI